jgi:hypothetical protein
VVPQLAVTSAPALQEEANGSDSTEEKSDGLSITDGLSSVRGGQMIVTSLPRPSPVSDASLSSAVGALSPIPSPRQERLFEIEWEDDGSTESSQERALYQKWSREETNSSSSSGEEDQRDSPLLFAPPMEANDSSFSLQTSDSNSDDSLSEEDEEEEREEEEREEEKEEEDIELQMTLSKFWFQGWGSEHQTTSDDEEKGNETERDRDSGIERSSERVQRETVTDHKE